jgi:hypothetical protein
MAINSPNPSHMLYIRVRAGFVAQGTTFTAWCRENHLARPNVASALIGAWNGPKGRAIRERVIRAARISEITP